MLLYSEKQSVGDALRSCPMLGFNPRLVGMAMKNFLRQIYSVQLMEKTNQHKILIISIRYQFLPSSLLKKRHGLGHIGIIRARVFFLKWLVGVAQFFLKTFDRLATSAKHFQSSSYSSSL